MTSVTYEVLALRYGIFDGRRQFQNYTIPDDHAAPDPLDFFVFALRGGGRTIVMDTGFNPVSAQRRGRELMCSPAEALRNADIDPAAVKDVVLTHMHWDHAGGMEYFRMQLSISRRRRWRIAPARACASRSCAARST